jgi:hypothetical protein
LYKHKSKKNIIKQIHTPTNKTITEKTNTQIHKYTKKKHNKANPHIPNKTNTETTNTQIHKLNKYHKQIKHKIIHTNKSNTNNQTHKQFKNQTHKQNKYRNNIANTHPAIDWNPPLFPGCTATIALMALLFL